MRLGTCIAAELAAGLALATGALFAASWGIAEARDHFSGEAQAAGLAVDGGDHAGPIAPVDPIGSIEPRHAVRDLGPTFFGVPDAHLLAPLRDAAIERVKFNRGGSSVSMRIDFAGGGRAAFKPDQINEQTVPRYEVAAFRIDRLLGLGAVPPALAVRYRMSDVIDHLDRKNPGSLIRLRDEVITSDGWVRGELSWWIPEIEHARIGGFAVDGTDGIVTWKRYLTVGNDIPESEREMAAQISAMVLFDHLINNSDRWSGNNTRSSPDNEQLYFMDNALSFGRDRDGHTRAITYLKRAQKFSRRLVERMRKLRSSEVREALADDRGPYSRLIDEEELRALMARRDYAMEYIEELIEEHGEDAVLVFP